MTTINDINDLARILREQPEWVDTLRSLLLTQELLELPDRLAELVKVVEAMNQRLDRMEGRLDEMGVLLDGMGVLLDGMGVRLDSVEGRLGSLEGRFSNLEGNDYERRVRYRVLSRVQQYFGMADAYLALTQNDPEARELSRAITHALRNSVVSHDEVDDLHNTDIIISDPDNRHAAIEVSITASREDVERAQRRAETLGKATGGTTRAMVATVNLREEVARQAESAGVAVLVIPAT